VFLRALYSKFKKEVDAKYKKEKFSLVVMEEPVVMKKEMEKTYVDETILATPFVIQGC
jgi:hypothetical protein